jgi:hypothetical protein
MTAILKSHISLLSWCGILLLCLAICLQLLGAPGTLFNFADSQDDFQASVMVGYTITSDQPVFLLTLKSSVGFTKITSVPVLLRLYNFFHPPLFV